MSIHPPVRWLNSKKRESQMPRPYLEALTHGRQLDCQSTKSINEKAAMSGLLNITILEIYF